MSAPLVALADRRLRVRGGDNDGGPGISGRYDSGAGAWVSRSSYWSDLAVGGPRHRIPDERPRRRRLRGAVRAERLRRRPDDGGRSAGGYWTATWWRRSRRMSTRRPRVPPALVEPHAGPTRRRHGPQPRRRGATGSWRPTAASSTTATRLRRLSGAIHLNQPIVGMAPTTDGRGYWLVASDGGIFSYGDAAFYGSTGRYPPEPADRRHGSHPRRPRLLARGVRRRHLQLRRRGVRRSTGAIHLNQPIVGVAPTADGTGTGSWRPTAGSSRFGGAGYYGSTAGTGAERPRHRHQSGHSGLHPRRVHRFRHFLRPVVGRDRLGAARTTTTTTTPPHQHDAAQHDRHDRAFGAGSCWAVTTEPLSPAAAASFATETASTASIYSDYLDGTSVVVHGRWGREPAVGDRPTEGEAGLGCLLLSVPLVHVGYAGDQAAVGRRRRQSGRLGRQLHDAGAEPRDRRLRSNAIIRLMWEPDSGISRTTT